jgi:hypothetical protein
MNSKPSVSVVYVIPVSAYAQSVIYVQAIGG